ACREMLGRRDRSAGAVRFSDAALLGWSNRSGLCLSCRFLPRHFGSNQPQLQLPGRTGVVGNEVLDMFRDAGALNVAAGLDFDGDIFRDVLRPMLKCIEGDNADRVVKLPRHEIGDDSFEVGAFDFGFAVNAAQLTEAVDYEVNGLIRAVGHDCRRPTRPTPNRTPHATEPGTQ